LYFDLILNEVFFNEMPLVGVPLVLKLLDGFPYRFGLLFDRVEFLKVILYSYRAAS